MYNMFKCFPTAISGAIAECHFAKIAHKVANSKTFSKISIISESQKIPFKMMHNMSMLRHQFSNEQWRGGGGGGGGG